MIKASRLRRAGRRFPIYRMEISPRGLVGEGRRGNRDMCRPFRASVRAARLPYWRMQFARIKVTGRNNAAKRSRRYLNNVYYAIPMGSCPIPEQIREALANCLTP